jgi:hypothetical protein
MGGVVFPVIGHLVGGALGAWFGGAAYGDKETESTQRLAQKTSHQIEESPVEITEEESIVLDSVIIYLRDYLNNSEQSASNNEIYPNSLIKNFEGALREHGVQNVGEIVDLLRSVALSDNSTMAIFEAIGEMRSQLHGQRSGPKPSYSKNMGDPVRYLLENYGEDIRTGRLGPGQLHAEDANLYKYASAKLRDDGSTLGGFFELQKASVGNNGSNLQRRARAAAVILNTSEVEAARFLRTLQPTRLGSERKEISQSH